MCPRNKERSPVTPDKAEGAFANSELHSFYSITGGFAMAWLELAYSMIRLIHRPLGAAFWCLSQYLDRLEVAILTHSQADD
jgi:hypothetical protein